MKIRKETRIKLTINNYEYYLIKASLESKLKEIAKASPCLTEFEEESKEYWELLQELTDYNYKLPIDEFFSDNSTESSNIIWLNEVPKSDCNVLVMAVKGGEKIYKTGFCMGGKITLHREDSMSKLLDYKKYYLPLP